MRSKVMQGSHSALLQTFSSYQLCACSPGYPETALRMGHAVHVLLRRSDCRISRVERTSTQQANATQTSPARKSSESRGVGKKLGRSERKRSAPREPRTARPPEVRVAYARTELCPR